MTISIEGTRWLRRGVRQDLRGLEPSRPRGVLARAAGLVLLSGALCALATAAVPPASPARALAGAAEPASKDGARVARWNGPLAATARALPQDAPWTVFDARPAAPGEPARFAASDGGPAAGAFVPAPAAPAPAWREESFAQVAVLDGRTLLAGDLRIRLAGLDLPGADEACRTLDGRVEPCRQRAATVLELNTRHRRVSCRYQASSSGEAAGACRVGGGDLGERVVLAGLARRSPGAR